MPATQARRVQTESKDRLACKGSRVTRATEEMLVLLALMVNRVYRVQRETPAIPALRDRKAFKVSKARRDQTEPARWAHKAQQGHKEILGLKDRLDQQEPMVHKVTPVPLVLLVLTALPGH